MALVVRSSSTTGTEPLLKSRNNLLLQQAAEKLRGLSVYRYNICMPPKILVIDDEPSIVNLVSSYLKAEGYEVFTASDGPSGLKSAQAFKPDFFVLDFMPPGMDGIELLSRLRRESDVYVRAVRSHP